MIRITIELISAVHPSRSKILGIAEIANDGSSNSPFVGSYNVRLNKMAPKERELWKIGRVVAFPRKKKGVWDLLYVALRNIVGPRNP